MTCGGWVADLLAEITEAAHARNRERRSEPTAEPITADPMIALSGPAPCDDCRSRKRCATGLACSAFKLYVDGASQDRWAIAPRVDASAYRYARIFSDARGRYAKAA